jgi:hypothetical protein
MLVHSIKCSGMMALVGMDHLCTQFGDLLLWYSAVTAERARASNPVEIGRTAGQGCRARLPSKAAGQGFRARLPGKVT